MLMNSFRVAFILMTFLIGMASCSAGKQKELIIGTWTGVEWLVNGKNSDYNATETTFTFGDSGNYSFAYGSNIENGEYFISNGELFTTPDGGIKMMVKIPKITQDTLVFNMNRGGQAESLTLVRK